MTKQGIILPSEASDEDILLFYEGKEVNKQDRLLLITAKNNYEKGKEEGKQQALSIALKEIKKFLPVFNSYYPDECSVCKSVESAMLELKSRLDKAMKEDKQP